MPEIIPDVPELDNASGGIQNTLYPVKHTPDKHSQLFLIQNSGFSV